MAKGTFFKLYRSLPDSAVFADAEMLRLWIYILCTVSYKEEDVLYDGKVIHLLPGQLVTGRKALAQRLRTAESKVYRMLLRLAELGNVNIKSNNKFTLVTVEKWGFYQGTSPKVNSTLNNKRTTNEQQTNNKRTAGEHNQRNKEIYNIYNNIYPPYNPPLEEGEDESNTDAELRLYGEYGNVMLTESEYAVLKRDYREEADKAIKGLDLTMAQGERYKLRYGSMNHFAVLSRKLMKADSGKSSSCKDSFGFEFTLDDILEKPT